MREARDYKQYFTFPAFLFATLCYAFWLSFSINVHTVSPELWPLAWLLLVFVAFVNPFPILARSSRYWLIRRVLRLLTSGTQPVQFADFWLGDQFTSLAFPLGNIYFIACSYHVRFNEDTMETCSRPREWGVPFVIATLPLLSRLVQSIRRWIDSGLYTHLINGGKYGSGIIYYLFYYLWRHNGAIHDASFVLFCLFGAIYVAYATIWDFLMDWSVLKPHARYPLLRNDVLYLRYIPAYYVALATNIVVRLAWIFYVPADGPNSALRSFIISMLEILRRWQWNFYRLENEHRGNTDQYRMTREIPLFYVRDPEAKVV
ncbi:EXS family-domain-containing protein [Vararia minispora EC-137]|uniref:EXS family-domain-containing protein n=1 Tax=Vararia minispora EC-137 TaxID=1314806 RepID=A0ACB8QW83_9AGAM|nr:EXS family-domain-containing protein [Vararia minispora EC-137]